MRKISDVLFCHVDKKTKKLTVWHTCGEYKKGRHGPIRVELQRKGNAFNCPHCDFKYSLNRKDIEDAYRLPAPTLEFK